MRFTLQMCRPMLTRHTEYFAVPALGGGDACDPLAFRAGRFADVVDPSDAGGIFDCQNDAVRDVLHIAACTAPGQGIFVEGDVGPSVEHLLQVHEHAVLPVARAIDHRQPDNTAGQAACGQDDLLGGDLVVVIHHAARIILRPGLRAAVGVEIFAQRAVLRDRPGQGLAGFGAEDAAKHAVNIHAADGDTAFRDAVEDLAGELCINFADQHVVVQHIRAGFHELHAVVRQLIEVAKYFPYVVPRPLRRCVATMKQRDLVAALQQVLHGVPADEAGTADYKYFHASPLKCVCLRFMRQDAMNPGRVSARHLIILFRVPLQRLQ